VSHPYAVKLKKQKSTYIIHHNYISLVPRSFANLHHSKWFFYTNPSYWAQCFNNRCYYSWCVLFAVRWKLFLGEYLTFENCKNMVLENTGSD